MIYGGNARAARDVRTEFKHLSMCTETPQTTWAVQSCHGDIAPNA